MVLPWALPTLPQGYRSPSVPPDARDPNAVLFVLKSGCTWRLVPQDLHPRRPCAPLRPCVTLLQNLADGRHLGEAKRRALRAPPHPHWTNKTPSPAQASGQPVGETTGVGG